jgi:AcrR family transcriptional regulator
MSAVEASPQPKPDARERILATAYELFSRRAIRYVGIDEVIERAGVAKATLYRHFPSKDDLVIAFVERREERWTVAWVEAEARRRGSTPEEQLLAISSCSTSGSSATTSKRAHSSMFCSRWAARIPLARRASGISRASARLWVVWRRRPHCVTQSPSRARGTFS